ncbi:unnamed protein product [Orchesella dallaii]|uniref:Uncharacterized protein n=1 Tax=Orchesella dallaii TaxID=48710 RepID=A0ABP1RBW5_9HEXA
MDISVEITKKPPSFMIKKKSGVKAPTEKLSPKAPLYNRKGSVNDTRIKKAVKSKAFHDSRKEEVKVLESATQELDDLELQIQNVRKKLSELLPD